MDFQDESYVRLYTRDTKTWLRLGFEGQCVLTFLIRKLDRSGVLDGIEEPAADVALVTGVPLAVVEVGLARLLERGVLELQGDRLVMPNYVEAQNCRQTDRVRKLESRAKRAAGIGHEVTFCDPESPAVTNGHPPSPTVTPSLAQPILTKPSERDARSLGSVPEVPGLSVVGLPLQPSRREQALCAKADALTLTSLPRHEFSEGWSPTKANQARGRELALTDDEIWARWETCKDRYFEAPFRSDEKQFNRELAFAAADKTKNAFKNLPKSQRDDFETPGHRRRA